MTNIFHNCRYAIRSLVSRPGFTAAAVLALAVGIGANSAMFSVVNSVLLKPLHYKEQDRIFMLFEDNVGQELRNGPFSVADFADVAVRSRSFPSIAAYQNIGFTLLDEDGAESLQGAAVSADFFKVLGVEPEFGRGFQKDEDGPQAPLSVLISHALWQRLFKSDPGIIGRVLNLGGAPHTVIGVMPPGFSFPRRQADVWRNMRLGPAVARGPYILWSMARLKDGVTAEAADRELREVGHGIEQDYPEFNRGTTFRAVPIAEFLAGNVRRPLYLLLGAVGFVLLIAFANVANLLLARATSREKELAVRAALGAGRGHIVRQLFTETMVLAAAGGLAGLAVAYGSIRAIVALAPPGIFRMGQAGIDSVALVYTALISVDSAVLFGLAPAYQASAIDLNAALKQGGRGHSDVRRRRWRSLLVVSEVALSLIPLSGAGLTIRSLIRLQNVDPGFDPGNVFAARMSVSPTKYNSKGKMFTLYSTVMDRIRSIPGVQSAALTNSLPPIQNEVNDSFTIEESPLEAGGVPPLAQVLIVSPGYFEVMRIPVVKGRRFTDQDKIGAPEVVLMSLGASRSSVMLNVIAEGMTLAAAGTAVGLAGSMALTRVLSGILYGVTATDPVTFAAVSFVLLAGAFAACAIPAGRATRIDAAVALRSE